ncbi:MAG: fibronectin type III domain-containing protein, partial [Candidatus Eremiobacteraeota bacterium]|nr:fibronectin type III domain-containing protein [Candidatus Eremiobacteraeota bacterium]
MKKDYYDKKGINLDSTFAAMKQLKGDMPVKTHAFVNITAEDLFAHNDKKSKCLYDSLGYGYMDMVAKTKGVLFSIQADKAEGLARCGRVIKESLEVKHEFGLSKPADKVDPATILAAVDANLVSHEYRVASNSVYLEDAGQAGSKIAIRHCEPDGHVEWNLTGFAGTPARFSVGLSWTTAEYATQGKVLWGLSAGNLNQSSAAEGPGTSHAVTVSGLTPNTVYYFQALSWDEFGQEKRSEVLSFRTLPDWNISGLGGNAARTSASLQWSTLEYPTKGRVHYGLSADNLDQQTAETAVANSQNVEITGLAPDTTYYFQCSAKDEFGLEKRSDVIALRTQPDWGITGFAGAATRSAVSLVWNTPDQTTQGKVLWGNSPALGNESATGAAGLSHSALVTGLNPSTDYYFQAVAMDADGNVKSSNMIVVRTADDWEIAGFSGTATQTTVSLGWHTPGYSTSGRVYWGQSESGLDQSADDAASGSSHSVTVDSLTPDTLYYFQAASTDADGIEKRSAVVAIRTEKVPLPTWTIANFTGSATKNSATLTWETT